MKKILLSLSLLLMALGVAAQATIQAPMPAQTSTFSTNARGYWFTSPTCFTMTGVEVPTTASSGAQSIAVVRFWGNTPPPAFSTTTNNFTVLFLAQNSSVTGMIPVNIQIEAGDVIGVLGVRNNVNSYAGAGNSTTIDGFTVPLTRLGMQFPLATTPPQQLWTETAGNISRCWMYYDSLLYYNLTATPTGPTDFQFDNDADSTFTSVWDYGDGSPLETAYNPTHTYAAPGTYAVCSYITTSCETDTVCTTVTVCGPDPISNFGAFPSGASVSFADSSSFATQYIWDFGDGSGDTLPSPTHTYSSSGTYSACLITLNDCGIADTLCTLITICIPSTANFTFSNNGGAVDFNDFSNNADSILYVFGDGSTSNVPNASHTYAANGDYNVCMYSYSMCGNDTFCTLVSACPIPVAAGFGSSLFGGILTLTDSSSGAVDYLYTFGDGNSSNASDPIHTYTLNGTYQVCQIVSSACEADTLCTSITACPEVLSAGYTFSSNAFDFTFVGTETGGGTYSWTFGDGGTSTALSPTHTYTANGQYEVCFTNTNICGGSVMFCDTITVNVVGISPMASGTHITVAPNPFHDQTLIRVEGKANTAFTVELFDLSGKRVQVQEGQYNQDMVLRRNGLAAGMYAYRIREEGGLLGQGKLIIRD